MDIKTFKAKDENGIEIELRQIIQKHVQVDPLNPNAARGPFLDRLETADGKKVKHVAQGVYEIPEKNGQIRLTSDDSNAPIYQGD